jgi:hypothetical protein
MTIIKGPAAAAAVLEALLPSLQASLDAARSVSDDALMDAIEAAKLRLRNFANSTMAANLNDSAEVEAVDRIDKVARDLHSRLTIGQIGMAVGAISATAAELNALSAQLGLLTDATERAAKSIALDPVKKAVDAMTAMVNSVKSLKANLDAADPDEAQVIAEIDKLAEQFEALRTAVNGGG